MADLHTATHGETGPHVLFLHGLFGQGRNWNEIGKRLADDHRVTLVDLPHHGRSGWNSDFDYPQMAGDVAALIDPEDPPAVVGHSMGGKAAMALALLKPELVERLCVVDVLPVAYERMGLFSGYVEAMRSLDLSTLDSRSAADDELSGTIPERHIRAFLLQNLRRDGDGWRWQINLDVIADHLGEIGDWPGDRFADVEPYKGPTLLIGGATSDYVDDQADAAMQRWFPRTRRTTIKNAGHWVHSERPDVFLTVLRRFLPS